LLVTASPNRPCSSDARHPVLVPRTSRHDPRQVTGSGQWIGWASP
jgi:hypothetical protein